MTQIPPLGAGPFKHNSHTWQFLEKASMENWDPKMISDLHQHRLEKYASIRGISEHKAIMQLMGMHAEGRNVAEHMSAVIGEDHLVYIQTLVNLGENPMHIR